MNTTLSAPQAAASQHPLPLNAGHDHLSLALPTGDALRRLPLSSRLRLRAALWLLERAPAEAGVRAATVTVLPSAGDPRAVAGRPSAPATESSARERAAAGREARASYEALRTRQATASRML